ncbi:MAG: response regulator [Deltaproteobacteria bacterium]|nr:response regulator [Deltaproteobacteria bacterium]
MEYEDVVRKIAGKMLKRIGHRVEIAKEGTEAIDLYKKAKESGEPFDAVILDLTVRGGMGGKEAIQKLIKIDPGVKGIVTSGYISDPVLADYEKYGFQGVIAKPFKMDELSRALLEVMKKNRKSN